MTILDIDIRHRLVRRWMAWRGMHLGVNGEYSFIAAEAGATSVKAVDVFGPTPEFEEKHATPPRFTDE